MSKPDLLPPPEVRAARGQWVHKDGAWIHVADLPEYIASVHAFDRTRGRE